MVDVFPILSFTTQLAAAAGRIENGSTWQTDELNAHRQLNCL